MTFDKLIETYEESYIVTSSHSTVAENIILACEDLIARSLKTSNDKTFNFIGEIENSGAKENLKNALSSGNVVSACSTIDPIFTSKKSAKNFIYEHISEEFNNIIVLSSIGLFKGSKKLYDELASFNKEGSKRPITSSGSNIIIRPKLIKEKCEDYIKSFKMSVNGKIIVGEYFEEDVLMHGNQVIGTATEGNITYNIEKSGDLPSDKHARDSILFTLIEGLDQRVDSGEVSKYEVIEGSGKTIIKTYFNELDDYNQELTVNSIL